MVNSSEALKIEARLNCGSAIPEGKTAYFEGVQETRKALWVRPLVIFSGVRTETTNLQKKNDE